MGFDEGAPRMMLPAVEVRAGDYVRRTAHLPWRAVTEVVGNAAGVTITFEGDGPVNFSAQRTLEVSRRTRWVEVADRFRVVDEHAYLDREDEFADLSLDEAAARLEDLTGVEAAQVLSDVEEGIDWPWRWTDEETGREVTMSRDVERDPPRELPEAGEMSTSDGLGA